MHRMPETKLLIVPYGIETEQGKRLYGDNIKLLIVPYGIETFIGAFRPAWLAGF